MLLFYVFVFLTFTSPNLVFPSRRGKNPQGLGYKSEWAPKGKLRQEANE